MLGMPLPPLARGKPRLSQAAAVVSHAEQDFLASHFELGDRRRAARVTAAL
jgi:hypothetical protein